MKSRWAIIQAVEVAFLLVDSGALRSVVSTFGTIARR